MKKLFALMLSLMMALSLTACSTSEAEEADVIETLDTNVYVAIGTDELDLEALVLPLDDYDYVSIEIDEEKSDYDLSTAGEYTLVVVLTHEDGTTTELSLTLVVDAEEVVEEKIAEQVAAKLTDKDTTIEAVLALTEEDESTTSSTSSSSGYSGTGGYVSGTNNGLSTNASAYGLDASNIWVQEAMKLVGDTGLCSYIAGDLVSAVLGTGSLSATSANGLDWATVESQLEIGDLIYYNYMKSGSSVITQHVSVYLGNGLALHGNWTGGVARIASVYQEAQSYNLKSYTHTVSSCSSCTVSTEDYDFDSMTAEEILANGGVDTSGMSEATCAKDYSDMTLDEANYCIVMGYLG